jgi:tetratricopeptide (TPR) repeat protein
MPIFSPSVARLSPSVARPLVLIYPLQYPEKAEANASKKRRPEQAPAVKEDTSKPDGYTPQGRLRQGVLAVQRFLVGSQVVDVKIYSPEDPSVIRALKEGRIRVNSSEPSEIDDNTRLKIARAMGALYTMTVVIDKLEPKNPELPSDEMRLVAVLTEVQTKQHWQEISQAGGVSESTLVGNTRSTNLYDTLANTITMRFMAGPLRSYAKSVPDPAMLPQSPRPLDLSIKPLDMWEEARNIRTRGTTLIKDNRIEDGIQVLRRAINLTPRASEGRIALIQAYLDHQYLSETIIEARRALQVIPNTDTTGRQKVVDLLLEAARRKGDSATSRVTLERLLQDDPTNIALRIQYAESLLAQGDKLEAERSFKETLRLAPDSMGASNGLIRLALIENDMDKAISISENTNLTPMGRFVTTQTLVQFIITKTHTDFVNNKLGWEQSTLSREFFYKSIVMQQGRLKKLPRQIEKNMPSSLLKDVTETVFQLYNTQKRQLNILTQILDQISIHLESGSASAKTETERLLETWDK